MGKTEAERSQDRRDRIKREQQQEKEKALERRLKNKSAVRKHREIQKMKTAGQPRRKDFAPGIDGDRDAIVALLQHQQSSMAAQQSSFVTEQSELTKHGVETISNQRRLCQQGESQAENNGFHPITSTATTTTTASTVRTGNGDSSTAIVTPSRGSSEAVQDGKGHKNDTKPSSNNTTKKAATAMRKTIQEKMPAMATSDTSATLTISKRKRNDDEGTSDLLQNLSPPPIKRQAFNLNEFCAKKGVVGKRGGRGDGSGGRPRKVHWTDSNVRVFDDRAPTLEFTREFTTNPFQEKTQEQQLSWNKKQEKSRITSLKRQRDKLKEQCKALIKERDTALAHAAHAERYRKERDDALVHAAQAERYRKERDALIKERDASLAEGNAVGRFPSHPSYY